MKKGDERYEEEEEEEEEAEEQSYKTVTRTE